MCQSNHIQCTSKEVHELSDIFIYIYIGRAHQIEPPPDANQTPASSFQSLLGRAPSTTEKQMATEKYENGLDSHTDMRDVGTALGRFEPWLQCTKESHKLLAVLEH